MTSQAIWSDTVMVSQIPETGLHREIVADEAVRAELARIGGLREVTEARGVFDLAHVGGERVRVTGRVTARIGQTCVVTLDPMTAEIDEPIDLEFAPPEVAETQAKAASHGSDDDDQPEPPETIANGTIDLGELAAEYLFLGVDPYPRKPGAVFEAPNTPPDPEDHPFAALKALKARSGAGDGEGNS